MKKDICFISSQALHRSIVSNSIANLENLNVFVSSILNNPRTQNKSFDILILDLTRPVDISGLIEFTYAKKVKNILVIEGDDKLFQRDFKKFMYVNIEYLTLDKSRSFDEKIRQKFYDLQFTNQKKSKIVFQDIKQLDLKSKFDLILIGASTGGPEAIKFLIQKLSKTIPPTLVIIHMNKIRVKDYCTRLSRLTKKQIVCVEKETELLTDTIYIAGTETNITVQKKNNSHVIAMGDSEKLHGHCPSIDVLFFSAATLHSSKIIGILLTGMGNDGAKGLLKLNEIGAITIAQDEESSAVYGMPKAAAEIGAVDYVVGLKELSEIF